MIWVARFYPLIILALTFSSGAGFCKDAGADSEESEETSASMTPRLYLDVTATYATIPASSFAIGFRNSFSLANLTSLSAQSIALSLPITVDVSDRLSIYAGLNTYASRSDGYAWSSMIVDSWSAGFQFVAYEQKGGYLPSVTVQSTFTQSISGVIGARGTARVMIPDPLRNLTAFSNEIPVRLFREFLRIAASLCRKYIEIASRAELRNPL